MENEFYFNTISKRAVDSIRDKDMSMRYYINMMLNRTAHMFKWEGLPTTIPQRMLELMLQSSGKCVVTEFDGKLYAYNGGYGGVPDEYYRPKRFIINNPYQKFNKECIIDYDMTGDGDCILLQNDTLMMGLVPIISRYSSMLVESDISMMIATINQRLISICVANDGTTKNAFEEFMKKIIAGDLSAIVMDDKSYMDEDHFKTNPYASTANTNVLSQLIETNHYIFANLCRELGINENYNGKRESITASESELSEDFTHTLVDDMLACRKKACEELNKKYGLNISVEFDGVWKQNMLEVKAELGDIETSAIEEKKEKEVENDGLQEN